MNCPCKKFYAGAIFFVRAMIFQCPTVFCVCVWWWGEGEVVGEGGLFVGGELFVVFLEEEVVVGEAGEVDFLGAVVEHLFELLDVGACLG